LNEQSSSQESARQKVDFREVSDSPSAAGQVDLPHDELSALLSAAADAAAPSAAGVAARSHLAYFISDAVDGLDLSAFNARYAGGGPRNQVSPSHDGQGAVG